MNATTSNELGAGRLVTAFATSDPATGPPRDIVLDRDAASADDFRPEFRQDMETTVARIECAIVGVVHRLRDALARRQAVRELRLLGRSRLADIGIEPNDIERVVDAMIAVRRDRATIRGRSPRPRSDDTPRGSRPETMAASSMPDCARMNASAR